MPAPNDTPGGGQTLPPTEAAPAAAAPEPVVEAAVPGPAVTAAAPVTTDTGPRPFDFRQPSFLAPADLRRLRQRHEDFVRSLSARLSIYLRLEFGVTLTKFQILSYRQFTESLPNPTHLTLFKAEPLRGVGVLEIPRGLGVTIVERLLGGTAQGTGAEHEFSEIEIALLDQVVHLMLTEWCNLWSGFQEMKPALLGHEDNPKFLQTAPRDAVMLSLGLEAKIGECASPMQLALPCSMIEPLVRKLGPAPEPPVADARLTVVSCPWNRNFDDVPVPVTAMWNDLQMTARQLASLKPGDVLPLDAECTRHVKLRLADLAKFEGRLGTTNGKWAVAVTGRVPATFES